MMSKCSLLVLLNFEAANIIMTGGVLWRITNKKREQTMIHRVNVSESTSHIDFVDVTVFLRVEYSRLYAIGVDTIAIMQKKPRLHILPVWGKPRWFKLFIRCIGNFGQYFALKSC